MTVVFKPATGTAQNAMRSLVRRATAAPAATGSVDPVTG